MPDLHTLDVDECLRLLESHPRQIGRVGFVDDDGPAILPVNYRMSQGLIVFHTEAGSSLLEATMKTRVAFQVDHIDDTWEEGWSVLIRGTAREVSEEETQTAHDRGLHSWAHRDSRIVAISPVSITGRRVA